MDDLNRTMIASGFMLSLWAWASRPKQSPALAVVDTRAVEPVRLVVVQGGLAEEEYVEYLTEAA